MCKGLRGSQWFCMTMNGAGTSRERAQSPLRAEEIMGDRHPEETVCPPHPVELGRDELKWEIPDNMIIFTHALRACARALGVSPSSSAGLIGNKSNLPDCL